MPAPHPERQRQARRTLSRLFQRPETVWVVHYACQSFAPGKGIKSPRITALVARNLGTGHSETFSLHAEAELMGLNPVGVLARLDALERSMLDKYFAFLRVNFRMSFLHWKMRSATYGFQAIEHRYAVLGGTPVQIAEQNRVDLAWLLEEIYGPAYVAAPHFETLARLNNIPLGGFLPGSAEADAFVHSDYLAVQRSTSAKVGLLFDIAHRAESGTLVTETSWLSMNLGAFREAALLFQNNPVKALAGVVAGGMTVAFAFWKLIVH